jgi:hypothetical protein
MEEYVDVLGKVLEKKNLNRFAVFPDVKPFKIIKPKRGRIKTEIKEILLKNPKKYGGRFVAIVGLDTYPKGFKEKNEIFDVHITIYYIHENGTIDKYLGDSWILYIKYLPDDLEKHLFKMKDVEKFMKLVYKRKILSSSMGMFYKEFEKEYNKLKEIKKTKKIKNYKI